MVTNETSAESIPSTIAVQRTGVVQKTAKGKAKNKPRKYNRGPTARQQSGLEDTTDLLIPRAAFAKVVEEIIATSQMDLEEDALTAFQEAAEAYLVRMFEDMNACAIHAKRVTIQLEDFHPVERIGLLSRHNVISNKIAKEEAMPKERLVSPPDRKRLTMVFKITGMKEDKVARST